MAKLTDYPSASLRAALQLAEAVDGFAGSCSADLAAEKLGKKISGAFSAQISATAKYGLIENKAGKLTVCPLYRNYKLAYTPDEATRHLREALLSPPLFNAVYQRFKGQKLPIEHFEKMLIKEFDVPRDIASRISGYFLDGAKQADLLTPENFLVGDIDPISTELISKVQEFAEPILSADENGIGFKSKPPPENIPVTDDFWLNIRGPGMNFSIEVKDLDDLDIVQIMLKKIERALKQNLINAS